MRWPWWEQRRPRASIPPHKPKAPGAGDGQGYPGRGLRSPALRCGGDDTAEARGVGLGRRETVARKVLHGLLITHFRPAAKALY